MHVTTFNPEGAVLASKEREDVEEPMADAVHAAGRLAVVVISDEAVTGGTLVIVYTRSHHDVARAAAVLFPNRGAA